MKKLQSSFTTPEQSKRLLELGVPADSADCIRVTRTDMVFFIPEEKNAADYLETYNTERNEKAEPCWSVGRLNEIFKICSDNHIEIYDLDLEGTQIERAMQAFENYAKYNWLNFSKLEE